MHMITDGNGGYIRQNCDGKFVTVRNIALGDSWDSKEKAQNVLSNQISPLLRGKFSVVPADEAREGSEYSAPLPADISFSKMLELLEAFDIDNDYLRKLLSDVDKDIGDIEHYIELKEIYEASSKKEEK